MFYTGFTLAQTVAVVPLALAGDRYDKKRLLLGIIAANAVSDVAFVGVLTHFHGTGALTEWEPGGDRVGAERYRSATA